jgi:predicted DNA-binding protein
MPRRLDLELSEEAYEALEMLSRRTGRSIRDLVEDLIAQSITPPLPPLSHPS